MFDTLSTIPAPTAGTLRVITDEPAGELVGEVILAPVFGATAHSMFSFSHVLTRNGFRVRRLDFRRHVGISDGEILDTALSSQTEDIAAAAAAFPGAVLVAVSLSCRPAIRVGTTTRATRALVLVTPVVDVASTIGIVAGQDYFAARPDALPATLDILDYEVSTDFVGDAQRSGLDDRAGTLADLREVTVPVRMIAGDADPWVDHDTVSEMVGVLTAEGKDLALTTIASAAHRLNRNPVVAARYIETMCRETRLLVGLDGQVDMPSFDETMRAVEATRRARRRLMAQLSA